MRKLLALIALTLALAGGVALVSLETSAPPQRAKARTADAPRAAGFA